MGEKFSEQQKAELRDAAARSRIDYEDDMRRHARDYQEQQAAQRKALKIVPLPMRPSAFQIAGQLAELLTAFENAVADLDDNVLSADVHVLRTRLAKVGGRLARMQRTTDDPERNSLGTGARSGSRR